ncbi:hypothetical protein DFQ27_005842 [Actinomortierella ambigua]|uniref:Prokaryotic-type class I peptide chain release factors domain-containing protein n=1 Tax=Actinomortierella ambigua TaxID=1343610 RepID=A0A9P6QL23_9FUNG|nr:hypothetical protein DFQ27_005842 [Actinomortierella ambigua]
MQAFRIQRGLSFASKAPGALRTHRHTLAWTTRFYRTVHSEALPQPHHGSCLPSFTTLRSLSTVGSCRSFTTGSLTVAARARSPATEEAVPDIYSIDPDFLDDNGMNQQERAKIEKWAAGFTKDQIPKGLLTINFVRASGPGGQNVNKVNTKVDMRFNIDEAVWLPPFVREQLKVKEASKINKNGELTLQSDAKRTQMANLEDCMGKLHDLIMKTAELPNLPDPESLARLERL